MDAKLKLASLILMIILLTTALSAVFQQVPIVPLDLDIFEEEDQTPYENRELLFVDVSILKHQLVFSVFDGFGVSHLRCNVLTEYRMGAWSYHPQEEIEYNGETLDPQAPPYSTSWQDSLTIDPAYNLSGFIPVTKDVTMLDFGSKQELWYSPEYQVFRSDEAFSSIYTVRFNQYRIPDEALNSSPVALTDEAYLQVPEPIAERLKGLAQFITSQSEGPYRKCKDIEGFLKTVYSYKNAYEPAPFGEDPVEWFLFESKEGICTHFNSAFVLLARSLGIPARLCVGYLIKPDTYMQHIYLDQAHVFAEIKLDGVGWVTFDATGLVGEIDYTPTPPPQIGTVTGTVFHDLNMDSQWQWDEPGIANQKVVVQNMTSGIMTTTTTGPFGSYIFPDLEVGEYRISVLPIGNLVHTFVPVFDFTLTADDWWGHDFGLAYSQDVPNINETVTIITSTETTLYRNQTLVVSGWVEGPIDRHTSGPMVFIYLVTDKSSTLRYFCGMNPARIGGGFDIQCKVPVDIPMGNYHLVAECAGDLDWNGSNSDPPVMVKDHAVIEFGGPSHLVAGISYHLSFTLREFSTSEPVPGQVLGVSWTNDLLITDRAGRVYLELLPVPGDHHLELLFPGSAFLESEVLDLTLEAFSPGVAIENPNLVRGEGNQLLGRVIAGDIPLPGEELRIVLMGSIERNITTDSRGYFSTLIELSPDLALETVACLFHLPGFDIQDSMGMRITARPSLEVETRGGDLSARLLDDLGSPLSDEIITFAMEDREINLTTDQRGVALLTMEVQAETNVTIRYPGSDLYQPVSVSMVYIPTSGPDWVLIGLVAVVIGGVIGGAILIRRRGRFETSDSVGLRPETTVPQTSSPRPYRTEFIGIAYGLPLVWEVGTPLHLLVRDERRDLKVHLDDEEIPGRRDSEGLTFVMVMEAGSHLLRLEGENGVQEETIRAVNYREEIVDLFASLMERWSEEYPALSKNMTPREVQAMVSERHPRLQKQLETTIATFELANYSHHPIFRREYEMMFKSMRELN